MRVNFMDLKRNYEIDDKGVKSHPVVFSTVQANLKLQELTP